jgi:hypothetical protein
MADYPVLALNVAGEADGVPMKGVGARRPPGDMEVERLIGQAADRFSVLVPISRRLGAYPVKESTSIWPGSQAKHAKGAEFIDASHSMVVDAFTNLHAQT